MHGFLRDRFSSLAHEDFAKVLTKMNPHSRLLVFSYPVFSPRPHPPSSFYSAKAASKRAQGHHLVSSNQWVNAAWLLPLSDVQEKIMRQG